MKGEGVMKLPLTLWRALESLAGRPEGSTLAALETGGHNRRTLAQLTGRGLIRAELQRRGRAWFEVHRYFITPVGEAALEERQVDKWLRNLTRETKRRYSSGEAYHAEVARVKALLEAEYLRIGEQPPHSDERIEETIIMIAASSGCTIEQALRKFVRHVIELRAARTGARH
jgi:hypothetical protein